mgnify:CR=1 FL=1
MNEEDYDEALESICDLHLKGVLTDKEYVRLYTRLWEYFYSRVDFRMPVKWRE